MTKIYIFLQEEEHKYAVYFVNEELLIKLSYLGLREIFEKLNALNLSLKSIEKTTSAFIKKTKAVDNKNESRRKQEIFQLVAIIVDLQWS